MNSLVALGTCTAFSLAVLATTFPGLNWDAYCSEEPVMLLAFVLLGRSLERQARLRAATDLQALATLTPPTARLLLDADKAAAGPSGAGSKEKAAAGAVSRLPLVSAGYHVPDRNTFVDGVWY